MSEENLARALGLPRVRLINDLEATAYGIGELAPEQLYTLNEGDGTRDGHRGLIAAGTGLGMAAIFYDGARYHPMPSEGGHIDFAPRDEREFEMFQYLREKIGGRVSYERVLSGMGLFNIYSFLRDRGHGEEPAWLAEEIRTGDPSAAISRAALARKSELAETTLQMFVEIYGTMAGNLALMLKSTGGLYIGGGIAPKIMEKLKDGTFMRALRRQGAHVGARQLHPRPRHPRRQDRTLRRGELRPLRRLKRDDAHVRARSESLRRPRRGRAGGREPRCRAGARGNRGEGTSSAIALAGGSTPRKVYELLAGDEFGSRVDWANVHVFFGDERAVPPDHADSNFRMANEALLSRVPLPEKNIHRIEGLGDAAANASESESEMRSLFGDDAEWPRLDLVLLGMGDDGHTASLFPAHRGFGRAARLGRRQLGREARRVARDADIAGDKRRAPGPLPRQRRGQGRTPA